MFPQTSSGSGFCTLRPDPEVLADLQGRGFVEPLPASSFEGDREWRFHHSLIRDAVYETILKRNRPDMHRAAGQWLEAQARKTNRLDELAGRIGDHAERAGQKSAAADWYLRAGKITKTQGALIEARSFFDRTLELSQSDDHQRRWQALLERDEVLVALGDTENRKEGLVSLLQLAEEFDEPTRLAEVNYRQAVFFENTGEEQKALEISLPALHVSRDAGKQELEMRLLSIMLVCRTRVGELEEASALADELLLRSKGLEDETVLARVLTNVAVFYTQTGDIGKAVELVEHQIEINHRSGDRIGEAIGLGNVGYNYLQLGQFEKGRFALERALKLNEAIGARRMRAYNLINIGLCDWRSDNAMSAVQIVAKALTEFEAIGDAFGRGTSLLYLALVLEHMGDLKGAIQHFAGAREIFAEVSMRGVEHDAIAGMARCSLASGSKGEAKKFITELWDYLNHNGAKGIEFPLLAYQTCAMVFETLGEDEKSVKAMEAGYQALMTQAEKISNAELRQSYLDNVSENRTLFEMWSRKIF